MIWIVVGIGFICLGLGFWVGAMFVRWNLADDMLRFLIDTDQTARFVEWRREWHRR